MKNLRRLTLASLWLAALQAQAATVQQFQPQGKVAEQSRANGAFLP